MGVISGQANLGLLHGCLHEAGREIDDIAQHSVLAARATADQAAQSLESQERW